MSYILCEFCQIFIVSTKEETNYEKVMGAASFVSFKYMRGNIIPSYCMEKGFSVANTYGDMFVEANLEAIEITSKILNEFKVTENEIIANISQEQIKKSIGEILDYYQNKWFLQSDVEFCEFLSNDENGQIVVDDFISFRKQFPSITFGNVAIR